jgi:cytochrome P450
VPDGRAVAGNETLRNGLPGGMIALVGSFAAANRDEKVLADPDVFDPHRAPNPHLAFGHGPHFCLAAQLARRQMQALFAEVLARTTQIRFAGEPAYPRSNFQRGVKRLPVHWHR